MTVRIRNRRALDTIYVSPTGFTDSTIVSTTTNRISLPAAISQLKERRDEFSFYERSAAGEVLIELEDGTYDRSSSLDLFDLGMFGAPLVISGNTGTPGNVILNKTNGSAGFFRLFRSFVRFEGVTFNNLNGDGIAVVDNSFAELSFCRFQDTLFDCIFVDEKSVCRLEDTISFGATAIAPDTWMRCREGSTFISGGPTFDFEGNTWDFFVAGLSCAQGGFAYGPAVSYINAGAVTGTSHSQGQGGKIFLGDRTYRDVDLPGSLPTRLNNKDAHEDPFAVSNFTWATNQTDTDEFDFTELYRLELTAPVTWKWDFNVPNRGWRTWVKLENLSNDLTITDQADATITTLGATSGISWVLIVSDGTVYQVIGPEGAGGAVLPTTTKGDVIVHNGTTDVRLPVGTDTQILVANSATAEGVEWAPNAGGSAQNLFETIIADTGTTTADSFTDTLTIVGSGGIATSITGDTLTITGAAASPLTTKGDIYVFDTADQRLPIGADDFTLTAQASEATGLVWRKGVFGYNEEVLAATKTLTAGDPYNQLLDGGAADRDVVLPDPPVDKEGFRIANEGPTNNLLIKETAAGGVELTLLPGEFVEALYANTDWRLF